MKMNFSENRKEQTSGFSLWVLFSSQTAGLNPFPRHLACWRAVTVYTYTGGVFFFADFFFGLSSASKLCFRSAETDLFGNSFEGEDVAAGA